MSQPVIRCMPNAVKKQKAFAGSTDEGLLCIV
jgi:hypothetical protein